MLGLSTKRQRGDELDVVTRVEPFPAYRKVASEMLHLVGQAVIPVVDGVLVAPIDAQRAGYGYVKMLVPASDRGPHRAMLKQIGELLTLLRREGGLGPSWAQEDLPHITAPR